MSRSIIFFVLNTFLFFTFIHVFAIPFVRKSDLFQMHYLPASSIYEDDNGVIWTLFASDYFGYAEIWVARSLDGKNWNRPLYTAVPMLQRSKFRWRVEEHTLKLQWSGNRTTRVSPYRRATFDSSVTEYTVYKEALYADKDADGLSDLSENRLWTDAQNMDTDGDGKADGYDQNPLAQPREKLHKHDHLHKYVVQKELYYMDSNQLAVVEQTGQSMEYKRESGLVLSLSSADCDAWVNTNGYGVPILTCTVKDTLQTAFVVDFQMFYAPDDAWGYKSIYYRDADKHKWREVDRLESWRAE